VGAAGVRRYQPGRRDQARRPRFVADNRHRHRRRPVPKAARVSHRARLTRKADRVCPYDISNKMSSGPSDLEDNMLRRRFVTAVVVLGAIGYLGALRGFAQTPRPMGLVDLLNVPRLADPQVSPDGRDVVFTRAEADWKSGRRTTHIWRARIGGGEPIQLTTGADSETDPRWSPDGKTIAFTAKRGDNEFAQIYLLPVDGGEARQLTTHASAASDLSWTPDGAALYFVAPEPKTAEEKAR